MNICDWPKLTEQQNRLSVYCLRHQSVSEKYRADNKKFNFTHIGELKAKATTKLQ